MDPRTENNLPKMLAINGQGELLMKSLLEGSFIGYTDDRFQVSSGNNQFILKLNQTKEKFILSYAQVPHVYPLPDDLQTSIRHGLEEFLKKTIQIDFINAGTLEQKKELQNTSLTEGYIPFKHSITETDAAKCVNEVDQKYKQPVEMQKKASFFGRFFKPSEKPALQTTNIHDQKANRYSSRGSSST